MHPRGLALILLLFLLTGCPPKYREPYFLNVSSKDGHEPKLDQSGQRYYLCLDSGCNFSYWLDLSFYKRKAVVQVDFEYSNSGMGNVTMNLDSINIRSTSPSVNSTRLLLNEYGRSADDKIWFMPNDDHWFSFTKLFYASLEDRSNRRDTLWIKPIAFTINDDSVIYSPELMFTLGEKD